ncbi:MAG TPA: hypothetical protein VNF49_13050 [Candidatus Binataceae bacterium]|nr:hypothetical protein [Candidatus Binataceae bacterium]
MADIVDLPREAFVQPDERAIGERAVRVELLGAGRIQIGTRAGECRKARPVFHHDGLLVLGVSEVEQIVQPAPEIGLAPEVTKFFEQHAFSPSRQPRISRGVGTVGRMRAGGGAHIEARAG